MNQNTKKLILAALLAAFTCMATMVIKIPTPTYGYIHLGDGLVLLSGILLGPIYGGLAAGIGSMFADVFSGYLSFAPATLIIKSLTGMVAGLIFHFFLTRANTAKVRFIAILLGGIIGETIMVCGYFLYEAGLAAFAGGSFTYAALLAGITTSTLSIPFNIAQGTVGIVVSILIVPILLKLEPSRELLFTSTSKKSI